MGSGEARQPQGRRATLDVSYSSWTEGALSTGPAIFLGHLEVREKQVGRQKPVDPFIPAACRRSAGGSERRLRYSWLLGAAHLQDVGGGRPTQGNALPLSARKRSDRVD